MIKLTGVLGYHYGLGEWFLIDCSSSTFGWTSLQYKKHQIGDTYTEFFDVDLESVNREVATPVKGTKYPDVLTLEKSIENNIKFLKGCKL